MDAPSIFKSSNSIFLILLPITLLFSDSLSLSSSSTLKISFDYIHPSQIFWNILATWGRLIALIVSETLIPICHVAQHSHKLQGLEGGIFRGLLSCLPQGAAAAAAKSLQSCPTLCDPIDGSPSGSTVPGILQARTLEWVAISFSSAWKWKVKVKSLGRLRLLETPWTAAYQAPRSMGFSRQEYWSGVPLPSPWISELMIT